MTQLERLKIRITENVLDAELEDILESAKAVILSRRFPFGEYPAEIATWATVKALVRDEILTIGAEVEAVTEEQKEKVTEFEHKESSIRTTTKKKKTLEQLTEE